MPTVVSLTNSHYWILRTYFSCPYPWDVKLCPELLNRPRRDICDKAIRVGLIFLLAVLTTAPAVTLNVYILSAISDRYVLPNWSRYKTRCKGVLIRFLELICFASSSSR